MYTSKITVYRYGRPAQGVRVVLGFDGFINLGQTNPVFTNPNGVAFVSHKSTGMATVYIDGRDRGKVKTPGEDIYYI